MAWRNVSRSSGWMHLSHLLHGGHESWHGPRRKCGSGPRPRTRSPDATSQSQEPILPAASARPRPCSLLRKLIGRRRPAPRCARRPGCSSSSLSCCSCAGLAKQFGEHPHLGAQQFRHHRHGKIIHRARLIAAQIIGFRHVDGGNEDDRGLLEARMLADHLGQLEAVQFGHADIDQDDRDLGLEQIGQRFLGGGRRDQIFAQLAPASPHS